MFLIEDSVIWFGYNKIMHTSIKLLQTDIMSTVILESETLEILVVDLIVKILMFFPVCKISK